MPIFIDNRGKGERELADLLLMKKIPVEVRHIDSGDIVFNDIAIERKTISDLVFSVIGKERHLWDQLKVMRDTYKKTLLIIEGSIDWKDKQVSSIITSIVVGWQIPFIPSSNVYETATIISNLFSKYGCNKTSTIPPPAVRKGKTSKEVKWAMLQCVKGIGSKTANGILDKLPNIFTEKIDKKGFYNKEWFIGQLDEVKGLHKESKELLIKVLCNE